MKPIAIWGASCACLMLLSCAGGSGRTATAPLEGSVATQEDMANLRFHYRQQAVELREMARRRQIEADALANQSGADNALVQRKRDLAEDLLSAADEAEQKARAIRQHMPHNMLQ